MTTTDWLSSFILALAGGVVAVAAVFAKRIITHVRRHHPLANRRFKRRHRAELTTGTPIPWTGKTSKHE